jgi:mRNA-degrading endonuclease toxin of MazEF toxin-antitoxin module
VNSTEYNLFKLIARNKEKLSGAQSKFRLGDPDTQSGLDKLSGADTFQVRSVAEQRFVKRLGTLSDALMNSIAKALVIVLSLEP